MQFTSHMKKLLLSALAMGAFTLAQAQLISYSVQEVADHDTTGIASLAGMKTYRVYANLTNAADKVSAVYGDESSPLSLTSADGFFNSGFGSDLAQQINPLFFGAAPESEFDSWLTIGYAPGDAVDGNVGTVGLVNPLIEFNSGGDFILNDQFGGSWFVTEDPNAIAGDDLQVLICQLTTSGTFQGSFNIQVFVNGVQSNEQQAEGYLFSSDADAIFGCMDEAATNYNPDATAEGPCNFPCALDLTAGTLNSISCPGLSDGEITVAQTGGQFGVVYGIDGDVPSFTNANFDNLAGGDHFVIGIDGAGCVDTLNFTVATPAALAVNAVLQSGVSCFNDADAVIGGTATGGTGDLTFSLNDPNFTNPSSVLEFGDLGAGNYTVYVQDENGCGINSSLINVNNPGAINVYVTSSSNASCSDSEDGVIIVTTVGGIPGSTGFQYSVDQVTYTTGTSNNGSVLNVGPGVYTVYVEDVNGCSGQSANPVTISSPMALELTLASEGITCTGDANGSLTVAAAGGSGSYVYTFNGNDAMGETFFGDLDAGSYEVTVMDANDCVTSETVELVDPAPVVAVATSTDIACNGSGNGFVTGSATGGTGAYTYSIDGMTFVAGGTFAIDAAGEYIVYVQDENGCESDATATVSEPDAIEVSGTALGSSELGDGSVDITVTGGTAPYTFVWSGPDSFFSVDEDIDGAFAGAYSVTVTDSNDCEVTYDVEIALGLSDLAIASEISVYPNPSSGVFQVNLEGLLGERLSMEVTDMQGRIVYAESFGNRAGSLQHVMDLSGLSNGVYHFHMATETGRTTLQLVKRD